MLQSQHVHPEVSEFMVRRLDGQTLPALNARPESGVRYNGLTGQWVPESGKETRIDFDQIYSPCIKAQNSLIVTANKLARKRKLPNLNATGIHSWAEVEDSVSGACHILEDLAKKDNGIEPGFTGRLKGAFRKFCQNAGAGTTLVNLVPTDNYLSVLCGGLKVIFMALQQTDHYRQDIYSALEDLPFILNDHVAMVELNQADEELHRRAAALYVSLFTMMEVIFTWFLKSSLATGAKLFINPSKFSETLKNKLADVKLTAQRFANYTNLIATRRQQNLEQQTYSLIYMQGQSMIVQSENSQEILDGITELRRSHAMVLEKMSSFLGTHQDSVEERQGIPTQRNIKPSRIASNLDVNNILERYLYEPSLASTDCEHLLRVPFTPGHHIDEDRILAIKTNSRFRAWLILNESSLLLTNANSDPPSSLEMSFVSAQAFQRAMEVASEQVDANTELVPLAFFCSQHGDYRKDLNGKPTELAMSLLLQLVDSHRGFCPEDLAAAFDDFDPEDLDAILTALGILISRLPPSVIVVLIVDGLRFFGYPKKRRNEMADVAAGLVDIHRQEHLATLKFLFANSSRADFLEGFFTEEETLRLPRELNVEHGYNTLSWMNPVNLESPEE